jgi:DNA invertase Pin-like site-specific DNA recombinase
MATGKFVAYFRVSTQRQGQSGLGIEAQQSAVMNWLNGGRWELVSSFTEIESGKNDDRPQLQAALQACRVHQATLIIAKIDRLSRDAAFLLGLQKAGVKFLAVDMPEANTLTVGIMALVAQQEREMISARTKAALQAAKARGVKLGGDRAGIIRDIQKVGSALGVQSVKARADHRAQDLAETFRNLQGQSLREAAQFLNANHIPAPRGGVWQANTVRRVRERLGMTAG